MIEKYRPSNGTEVMSFQGKWCFECWRFFNYKNAGMGCQKNIDLKAMTYDIEDKKYPKEWIYVDDIPTCTAYIEQAPIRKSNRKSKKKHTLPFGE